ncbi:MAG: hypothetical protein JWP97_6780 [Labilithrix sp.]|nr:hypothetical protein [Labilithrix sp.]
MVPAGERVVVVDTNVLLSAILKEGSVPDRLLTALWDQGVLVAYDARIALEYREIVARPKFRKVLDPARAARLLDALLARGRELVEVPRWPGVLGDDSDRPFVEVALAARAAAIVTGNLKDYPANLGFDVLPPATQLARLG